MVPRKNVSLGVVETELLRELHALRDERLTDKDRQRWTRKLLATDILSQRRSAPIELPESARGWIERRTTHMVTEITTAATTSSAG